MHHKNCTPTFADNFFTKPTSKLFLKIQKRSVSDKFLGKLWKKSDGALINKSNLWESQDKWKFIKCEDQTFYIKNRRNQGVLTPTENDDSVIEAELKSNDANQLWQRGEENEDGYFEIINTLSKKKLAAMSAVKLEVKGTILNLDKHFPFCY